MGDLWIVRAGRDQAFLDQFIEAGCAFVGLHEEIGAEALALDRDELIEVLLGLRPDWTRRRVASRVGQTYRFIHEVEIGDDVVTYDPSTRLYLVGRVASQADAVGDGWFRRSVEWRSRVSRDTLSSEARKSLGSIMTVFCPSDVAARELLEKAVPMNAAEDVGPALVPPTETTNEESGDSLDELMERSRTSIDDRLAALDPYEMQDLVAGVLRAMGYQTRVSPRGSDRGVDIFASPDGLGLAEPRVFVEVKHRIRSAMGSQEVRSFLGGRQPGDRCLFVSTGGFSREARYEAERSNVPLTLVDLPRLRDLLVDHYDRVDLATKRLIPLARIYWPADA